MYALLYTVAFLAAITEVQSSINKGLVLGSGGILRINTTVPEAEYTIQNEGGIPRSSQLMILLKGKIASVDGKPWPYKYAELVFDGDLVLEKGSIVNIFGKYGLSIQSLNGNLTISSNISMTCAVNADGMDMCLGGYAQRQRCDTAYEFVPGAGPGCVSDSKCDYYGLYETKGAAGHGGKGVGAEQYRSFLYGWSYERENVATLIGGSSGWHEKNGFVQPRSGGEAIELRADNGTITLYSTISASAQQISSTNETFSGSSGGTIRLKARKVILQPKSRLEVDGSPGAFANNSFPYNENMFVSAGGAGGVVQIIAASVKIEQIGAISMKPGSSAITKSISDPGFLLITDNSGKVYNTWNSSWSFPNDTYSFGEKLKETVQSCQPNSLGTHLTTTLKQDPTDEQIRQIQLRSSCLKNESGSINPLDLAEHFTGLATDFHHVVANQSLTRTQLDGTVAALTEMRDVYIILANTSQVYFSLWDLFNNVSRIVDGILDPRNKRTWNDSKLITMLDLMDTVSEIAVGKALQPANGTVARLSYVGTNMAIHIMKYCQTDFQDLAITIKTRQTAGAFSPDSVAVPRETIATNLTPTDDVSVVIKVYNDVEGIFPKDVDSSISDKKITKNISHLVAITILINNKSVKVLYAPILINFVLQKPALKESTPHCVYWNKTLNAWKNDGIKLVSTNDTHVQCSTNHLTSFAVLFSTTNTKIPQDHVFALDLLTYICCGLSIAALFVTLIIFYSIEALSSDRHRIHMHLALSILLSQLLFLTGIDATKYRVLCGIVAGFLHYLFLASFSWMCVEGFHLYMKIVRVYRTESMRMMYYYIFGWGFPVVYVVVAASINSSGYGTNQACWLSIKNGFIWVFIGPVAIIALVNLVILVMVIKVVVTSVDIVESQRAKIMSGVKGVSVLLPLLGVTWVFGLLLVEDNSIVFHYIFAITNSLQGFFIFTFHCVGNSEVRTALRRFRERTFDFNSVFVLSNGDGVMSSVSRKNPKEKVQKSKVYPLKKISCK